MLLLRCFGVRLALVFVVFVDGVRVAVGVVAVCVSVVRVG